MTDELSVIFARRKKLYDDHESKMISNGIDTVDAAASEFTHRLTRHCNTDDGRQGSGDFFPQSYNPYTEFIEFSRKQINEFKRKFNNYDIGHDGYIDLFELKLMMEKLEAPQTHLGLKAMIKEVDDDVDGKINFREFLLIFRRSAEGTLGIDGLKRLASLSEINVSKEGVSGAKNFFEAKVNLLNGSNSIEPDIKSEIEERKKRTEEKRQRRTAFREKAKMFQQ